MGDNLESDIEKNIPGFAVSAHSQLGNAPEKAEFWRWMKDTYHNSEFMNSLSVPDGKERGILTLIRGKGAEWKTFLEYHPTFLELNRLSENPIDPLGDLYTKPFLSGNDIPIQVKTAFSNPDAVAQGMLRYPEEVKFAVNESLYDSAIKKGIPEERLVKVFTDKEIKEFGKTGLEELRGGKVNIGISLDSALYQGLKGAGIGAAVGSLISCGVATYRYSKGDIDGKEVGVQTAIGASQGFTIGGIVSLVNYGAKAILISAGASTAFALPITLAAGYASSKLFDFASVFNRGDYRLGIMEAEFSKDMYKRLIEVNEKVKEFNSQSEHISSSQKKNKKLTDLAECARKITYGKNE